MEDVRNTLNEIAQDDDFISCFDDVFEGWKDAMCTLRGEEFEYYEVEAKLDMILMDVFRLRTEHLAVLGKLGRLQHRLRLLEAQPPPAYIPESQDVELEIIANHSCGCSNASSLRDGQSDDSR